MDEEFQEIAHSGGKIDFEIKIEDDKVYHSLGWRSKSSNPASIYGVYALPQGIPISTIKMGGINQPWSPPPVENCYVVLIGSDKHGLFGRRCQSCKEYFRTSAAQSEYVAFLTCAYCGYQAPTHEFMTETQLEYVRHFVRTYQLAIKNKKSTTIDMDEIANMAEQDKPSFYYAEESQQTRFSCSECRTDMDILGQYGYCSYCGKRNSLQVLYTKLDEFEKRTTTPRFNETQRTQRENEWREITKLCVSEFEGFSRDLLNLLSHFPTTPARRKKILEINFHNPISAGEYLKQFFDFDILEGISSDEKDFLRLRFLRRHIYEHNSGMADDDYILASGDNVKKGQLIRERSNNISTLIRLIRKIATNFSVGVHSIT